MHPLDPDRCPSLVALPGLRLGIGRTGRGLNPWFEVRAADETGRYRWSYKAGRFSGAGFATSYKACCQEICEHAQQVVTIMGLLERIAKEHPEDRQ